MPDGWARTGDLVIRDDEGRYRLVGRLKDMIRRASENISAAEVEAVLSLHPAVRTAACIPVPDPMRGEEVKAYVELKPDGPATDEAAVHRFVNECLARFKVPRYIEFVAASMLPSGESFLSNSPMWRKA
jgi:crotonobetaine/carnitine-CoA ligase